MKATKKILNPQGARARARLNIVGGALTLVALLMAALVFAPVKRAAAAGTPTRAVEFDQTKKRVPNYDINLSQAVRRLPTAAQLQALDALKEAGLESVVYAQCRHAHHGALGQGVRLCGHDL